jgi:hypothetical protein
MSAALDELREQLFTRERKLDSREGTIVAWEDGLAASKCALGRACMERDTVRTQTEDVGCPAGLPCYDVRLHLELQALHQLQSDARRTPDPPISTGDRPGSAGGQAGVGAVTRPTFL